VIQLENLQMKAKTSLALATAVLLAAGVSVASAAEMSHSSSASTMGRSASDTLSLNSTQRRMAWKDLNAASAKQNLPSGFHATVGAVVPSTFKIEPIPSKVTKDVPSLGPYDFATVQGKVLIVNPSDKKIADIITS
jgi:hypothetical protein